ncbi:hypothetical protein TGRUB_364520 [Toxoplasma gondii RUB]|uniref:Uncharacterized protein n=1 Tax=Toxoplasma gondii RUB TaxID=935652 RepID=A0A086M361_TOXGO|nr:hypothetical protein TGRUB_364520 [Toxoplasma gondii RUB]
MINEKKGSESNLCDVQQRLDKYLKDLANGMMLRNDTVRKKQRSHGTPFSLHPVFRDNDVLPSTKVYKRETPSSTRKAGQGPKCFGAAWKRDFNTNLKRKNSRKLKK